MVTHLMEETMDRQLLSGEEMYWKGKPISSYDKEELIDIIFLLEGSLRRDREEHSRRLKVLTNR